MGQISIIAMAGTKRDLSVAAKFPPEVKWDKIVLVEIPDDHGFFPDLTGYEAKDYANLESTMEDGQLYGAMQKCVDAVMDFTTKNSDRLANLNFQNIKSTIAGMNEGGPMFAIAGFVSYEPMLMNKLHTLAELNS